MIDMNGCACGMLPATMRPCRPCVVKRALSMLRVNAEEASAVFAREFVGEEVVLDLGWHKLSLVPKYETPKLKALEPETPDLAPYVIIDTSARSDAALFWRPNSQGYTTRLDEAGRYTEQEAKDIEHGTGREDIAVLFVDVERLGYRTVTRDALHQAGLGKDKR